MKTIVFTGGGTAGHIMPNLALIDELKDFNIYYIGSNGMEKDIVTKYPNIKFIEIPSVKLIRSFTLKNFLIPFKLLKSISICKQILKEIKPDIIFSKGGYVSIPVCFAGYSQKIPILTHESDFSIGLANKLIARKSKYICCSFKATADAYGKNAKFTGSPIRKKILSGNKNIVINRHKISNTHQPIILIVGGSLGAQYINNFIWNNINELANKYTILHIVGRNNINKNINKSNYYQIDFANDIENYFALSDIVISRSGSNTIFELLALNKPMILIPLPQSSGSRGDQELNAKYFLECGYAELIKQDNLEINNLKKVITKILNNKNQYILKMKNANNSIGTNTIIKLINDTIKN
ncbi:MAG: UDP-N-acetylglucosamine--N-acetylmuramyl-(pentapeptide) pyrophosphoryl-undecaprenol N-acetylglucosamine transferase [Christensenellales bacterium]